MKASQTLIAAFLLALTVLPAQAIEPVDSCKEAATWVASLDRLPADYASFTALSAGYQKAVYHQLTDAERVALWQQQWQEALVGGQLTDDQKTLVAETASLMTEDLFAAMRAKEGAGYRSAKAEVAALEARLAAAFPQQQYAQLFARLGDSRSGGKTALLPLCDCSLFSSGADCDGTCQPKRCSWEFEGCGDFGFDNCDGRCL